MPLVPLFLGISGIIAASGVAYGLGSEVINTPSPTVNNVVNQASNTVLYAALGLGALYFIVNRK